MKLNARGLIVIDSGGNRPKHDHLIAANSDLVLMPLTLSPEDVAVASDHAQELFAATGADVRFVINRMPSRSRLSAYDHDLLDQLSVGQVIGHVGECRASRVLLGSDPDGGIKSLPTPVNNSARSIFRDLLDVVKF